MTDASETRRLTAADAGSFLGTFALIFAAILGLFAVDTVLAKLERAENRSEARHLFQEGDRLLAQGRNLDAVDRFRDAVSAEPANPVYQRALAGALQSAGKLAEAEAVLTSRLQRDPTDAEASLIMARALAKEQKPREAISYYHRAIYGRWANDSAANRVRARFELIELLARQGAKHELLAELLPLEDEAPTDGGTRKRIAHFFIAAGSPSRAVEIFRDMVRRDPRDADAYAGLGEAEFERGNYGAARTAFLAASRREPDNREIAAWLALSNQVLGLDPTQRRLSTDEQYRRSLALVNLTLAAVANCAGPAPGQSVQAAIDSARSVLAHRASTPRHEAVEANLDLAERLWQLRRQQCPQPVPEAEKALSLVLEKLAP